LGKPQTNRHEFFYWEFHEGGFQQAVRMGSWKAIRSAPGQDLELYNLQEDLSEKNNVALDHPDVVKKIEQLLKTVRTESKEWPVQPASKAKPQSSARKPAVRTASAELLHGRNVSFRADDSAGGIFRLGVKT